MSQDGDLSQSLRFVVTGYSCFDVSGQVSLCHLDHRYILRRLSSSKSIVEEDGVTLRNGKIDKVVFLWIEFRIPISAHTLLPVYLSHIIVCFDVCAYLRS